MDATLFEDHTCKYETEKECDKTIEFVETIREDENPSVNLVEESIQSLWHHEPDIKANFTESLLHKHINLDKTSTFRLPLFVCSICQKEFLNKKALTIHGMSHLPSKQTPMQPMFNWVIPRKQQVYIQPKLNNTATKTNGAKPRPIADLGEWITSCPACDIDYIYTGTLVKHIKEMHNGFKCKCSLCFKIFTLNNFIYHHNTKVHRNYAKFSLIKLKIHKSKPQRRRDLIPKKIGYKLNRIELDTEQKQSIWTRKSIVVVERVAYICSYCNLHFDTEEEFHFHNKSHNNLAQFKLWPEAGMLSNEINTEKMVKNSNQQSFADKPLRRSVRKKQNNLGQCNEFNQVDGAIKEDVFGPYDNYYDFTQPHVGKATETFGIKRDPGSEYFPKMLNEGSCLYEVGELPEPINTQEMNHLLSKTKNILLSSNMLRLWKRINMTKLFK